MYELLADLLITLILFGLGIIVVSIGINLFLYLIDTSPDKELMPFLIKRTIKMVLYVVFFITFLLFYSEPDNRHVHTFYRS